MHAAFTRVVVLGQRDRRGKSQTRSIRPLLAKLSRGSFAVRPLGFRQNRSFLTGDSPAGSSPKNG
jgi:hypothetical protein